MKSLYLTFSFYRKGNKVSKESTAALQSPRYTLHTLILCVLENDWTAFVTKGPAIQHSLFAYPLSLKH